MPRHRKGVSTLLILAGMGVALLFYLFVYPILMFKMVVNSTMGPGMLRFLDMTYSPLRFLGKHVPPYQEYLQFLIDNLP